MDKHYNTPGDGHSRTHSASAGPLPYSDVNIRDNSNLDYAVKLIHAVCGLAGSTSYVDDIRTDLRERGVIRALRDHNTPVLYNWLIEILSFQGISDAAASGYMARHGTVRWFDIDGALSRRPLCPSSAGIGSSSGCQYTNGRRHAPNPRTSAHAHCPDTRCGMAGSIRWHTAYFCSCGM